MVISGNTTINTDFKGGGAAISGTNVPEPVTDLPKLEKSGDTPKGKEVKESQEVKETSDRQDLDLTRKDVEEMVEALESLTETLQTKLNFSIYEATNDIVVKIMERETDEVIKQFPAEELLILHEKMQDLTGLLFNTDV